MEGGWLVFYDDQNGKGNFFLVFFWNSLTDCICNLVSLNSFESIMIKYLSAKAEFYIIPFISVY